MAHLSFSHGTFPPKCKHASVTLLLKKPGLDPSVSANFRPISNLNNISKIPERLFLTRFQPHIALSPNFNTLQSAYRKHHSTETSLIHLLDSIYYAADNGRANLLLSLDLSAAFDTVISMLFFSIVSLLVLASWVLPTIGLSPTSGTGHFQLPLAQLPLPSYRHLVVYHKALPWVLFFLQYMSHLLLQLFPFTVSINSSMLTIRYSFSSFPMHLFLAVFAV